MRPIGPGRADRAFRTPRFRQTTTCTCAYDAQGTLATLSCAAGLNVALVLGLAWIMNRRFHQRDPDGGDAIPASRSRNHLLFRKPWSFYRPVLPSDRITAPFEESHGAHSKPEQPTDALCRAGRLTVERTYGLTPDDLWAGAQETRERPTNRVSLIIPTALSTEAATVSALMPPLSGSIFVDAFNNSPLLMSVNDHDCKRPSIIG